MPVREDRTKLKYLSVRGNMELQRVHRVNKKKKETQIKILVAMATRIKISKDKPAGENSLYSMREKLEKIYNKRKCL